NCAVLLLRHLNRACGLRTIYGGPGSLGLVGACCSGWLVARDPRDRRRRILAQTKNRLAGPQPTLAFETVGDDRGFRQLAWQETVDLEADGALAGREGWAAPPVARCQAFLEEALAGGPRAVAELEEAAAAQGFSRSTLFRARRALRLE